MKDWRQCRLGEWIEDRDVFPGSAQVSVKGNKVTVFFPIDNAPHGPFFRFRRINGQLVRTG